MLLKIIQIAAIEYPIIISIYQLYNDKNYKKKKHTEYVKRNIAFRRRINWLTIVLCSLAIMDILLIK